MGYVFFIQERPFSGFPQPKMFCIFSPPNKVTSDIMNGCHLVVCLWPRVVIVGNKKLKSKKKVNKFTYQYNRFFINHKSGKILSKWHPPINLPTEQRNIQTKNKDRAQRTASSKQLVALPSHGSILVADFWREVQLLNIFLHHTSTARTACSSAGHIVVLWCSLCTAADYFAREIVELCVFICFFEALDHNHVKCICVSMWSTCRECNQMNFAYIQCWTCHITILHDSIRCVMIPFQSDLTFFQCRVLKYGERNQESEFEIFSGLQYFRIGVTFRIF